MIYLYSGTPGSGKSVHQAMIIYHWLQMGKPVIANYSIDVASIPRCKGEFLEVNNQFLKPDFLVQYAKEYWQTHRFKEGTIRLFIDEAQLLFNARSWDAKGRSEWIAFFTQHRKYGYDVFLVAQFDRMLDRQIRSLIEYEVIHRRVSNFGIKGKVLSLCAGGGLFVSVKVWYPLKEKVGSEFWKIHKRYTDLYDSYKDFGGEVANQGEKSYNSVEGREKEKLYFKSTK